MRSCDWVKFKQDHTVILSKESCDYTAFILMLEPPIWLISRPQKTPLSEQGRGNRPLRERTPTLCGQSEGYTRLQQKCRHQRRSRKSSHEETPLQRPSTSNYIIVFWPITAAVRGKVRVKLSIVYKCTQVCFSLVHSFSFEILIFCNTCHIVLAR